MKAKQPEMFTLPSVLKRAETLRTFASIQLCRQGRLGPGAVVLGRRDIRTRQ